MYRLIQWAAPVVLVLALAASAAMPAQAQGDLSPEEQAALDAAQQAMTRFLASETYSLSVTQELEQSMTFSTTGGAFSVVQQLLSEGSLDVQHAPDQPFDDRVLDLTQTSTQQMGSGDQVQVTEIGPNHLQLITTGGRAYMRLDVQPELAAFMPQGWQDVTESVSMFPGMEMINLDAVLKMGQAHGMTFPDSFFASVVDVELLEPDPGDEGAALRCRLTLDPARLLDAIGTEALASMFASNIGNTMDVNVFIEAMFTDPDTQYVYELVLDAEGALIRYREDLAFDSDITAAFNDAVLSGMNLGENTTITLVQETRQSYRVEAVNEPLIITAPELPAE